MGESSETWDRLPLLVSRVFVACLDRTSVLVADGYATLIAYNERHEILNLKSLVIYVIVVCVVCLLYNTSITLLIVTIVWLAASEKKVFVRRKKSDLREAVHNADDNTLALLAQFLAQKGHLESYPSKKIFEEERVKWANMLIRQCWPHSEPFFRDKLARLLEIVNHQLQERIFLGIHLEQLVGLRLESLRLGTKAPVVRWIKVVEHPELGGRKDHFVLEADILYTSDAELVLYSTKFKAGIRDLHVSGKLRVDFGPTITKMPLMGGIYLYMLDPPVIDFTSTSTACALDMVSGELFTKSLHSLISKVIMNLLVAPNSISVPFIDASAIRCPTPPGAIRVCVVEGRELRSPDTFRKIDSYCVVRLGAEQTTTPCVKNCANPVWGHWAQFVCTGERSAGGQDLVFHVLDRDPVRSDTELISLRLGTREIQESKPLDKWLQSEGPDRGQLRVQALWLPFSDDADELPVQLAEIAALQSSSLGPKDTKEGFSTVPVDIGHSGVPVLTPNPGGFSLFSCLALVWLDSASELPESSGNWRMTVRTSDSEQHSWTATEKAGGKWVWKQSFMFHLKTAHDTLALKLRSSQGSTVKGSLELDLHHLLNIPHLCTGNKEWLMTLNTDRTAIIRMECSLKILSPAGKAMEELEVINRKPRDATPPASLIRKELLRIGKSTSRGNFSTPKFAENNPESSSVFYAGLPLTAVPLAACSLPSALPPRPKNPSSSHASLRSSGSSSSLFYDRQNSGSGSVDSKLWITRRKRKTNETLRIFSANRNSVSLETLPHITPEKGSIMIRSLKRFKMPSKTRRHVKEIFATGGLQTGSVMGATVINHSGGPRKDS